MDRDDDYEVQYDDRITVEGYSSDVEEPSDEYDSGYLGTYLSDTYDGSDLIDGLDDVLLEIYSDGSLDDWLVATTQSQAEADTKLNDFLDEYGGTDLGGFIYDINGPFSSSDGVQNYYLISYPLQETIPIHQLQDYFSITFEQQPASQMIDPNYGFSDSFLFNTADGNLIFGTFI